MHKPITFMLVWVNMSYTTEVAYEAGSMSPSRASGISPWFRLGSWCAVLFLLCRGLGTIVFLESFCVFFHGVVSDLWVWMFVWYILPLLNYTKKYVWIFTNHFDQDKIFPYQPYVECIRIQLINVRRQWATIV